MSADLTRCTPDRRAFLLGLLACAALAPRAVAAEPQRLTVFAAASLKTALDEVSAAWTRETGKATVNSYAASSALARQIEAGAPADVFISADLDWMAYLAERKLIIPDTETRVVGNELVLVAPADSDARISIGPGFDLAGLLGAGRLAMGEVTSVPAGRYGKAALKSLGVWASVEARLAQAENVRAALKLVATGEARAGIVYQTDAVAEPEVKVLGVFPADHHPPIIYPAAAIAPPRHPDAGDFLRFLRSATAQAIFSAQGFKPLPAP